MTQQYEFEGIEFGELENIDAAEFLSKELILSVYDIEDSIERERVKQLLLMRAKDVGVYKPFKIMLEKNDKADALVQQQYSNTPAMATNMTAFPEQEFSLRCGDWIADSEGVWQFDSRGRKIFASRIPVLPVALIENISTNTEKVKLWFLKNGHRELIVDRSTVGANFKIVNLADKGLEVTSENAKHLVKFIGDCISMNLDVIPVYKSASQLGWTDYGFAPYVDGVVFDGEKENGALYNAVCTNGDYETWQRETEKYRENLYVRLAMDASFASVLIEKVNALPFVFHLWGSSGSGKTVALMVAMSIWGNPAVGKLVRTMNMTQNSMMNTAGFLNSIPFAGDELQTIKSRYENYDTLIMRVCEGIDRGRMSFDKNIEPKTWNCSFLFTGEEPCTKADSGGGVKNRVIECELIGKLFEDAHKVVSTVTSNFGFAGKIFTDYVMNATDLNAKFGKYLNEILNAKETTDKQASSMSLIMLADELVRECIYPNEKPLEMTDILPFLANESDVDVSERAYSFIINHTAQNANRFNDAVNGEIWGTLNDNEITINQSVLKRELSAHGFEFDAVKKKWKAKGYLIPNCDGKYAHSTSCNGVKAYYVKILALDGKAKVTDTVDNEDICI